MEVGSRDRNSSPSFRVTGRGEEMILEREGGREGGKGKRAAVAAAAGLGSA